MRSLCLYLLLSMGAPCVYGQSVMSDVDLASPASIVYLKAKPKLYLVNAEVRFYANFKIKYVPPVKGRPEDEFNMVKAMREIVKQYDPEEMEEEGNQEADDSQEEKVYVKIPYERIYGKQVKGWLDKKERAETFQRGFDKTVGRVFTKIVGGK